MQNVYKELQSGAIFIFISRYSNILIQIGVMSILARLISPEDFGVIAISMIFIMFFTQLSDAGLGTAIVQKKELTSLDINTFFLTSVFQGLFLSLIFIISIPYISMFYEVPFLEEILYALCICIFFFSITTVPDALNKKFKRFKQLGYISVISNITTGTIAILIALYSDDKIYALIVKVILDSVIILVLNFLISRLSLKMEFSLKVLKEVFNYSLFQFFYNTAHYFSRNIDNLFIGKYLGAASLGFYDKAYRLMIMPVQNLSNVISPVLHPVLSSFQDDKKQVVSVYLNLVKFLSLIGFPLSIYLYYAAPEIILIVFGDNWESSVIPFKYLALSVGFQMIISSSRSIFQTSGNTKALFMSSMISIVLLTLFFVYGTYKSYNLNEFSVLVLISYICSFFVTFTILFHYVLKVRVLSFLKVQLNSVLISFSIAVCIYFLRQITIENIFYSLMYKTISVGVVYLIVSILLGEKFLIQSLKKIISNFK